MKFPLISIGITTYNAICTVQQAIESALAQTWQNLEIIIVDDCSTDGTYEYLKKEYSHLKYVHIFRNVSNSGVAYSRNFIINKANGEFLAFFDDDDRSVPDRLAKQYSRISDFEKLFATPPLTVTHSSRRIIHPSGASILEKTMGTDIAKVPPQGIPVAKRILLGHFLRNGYGSCATCSQMARVSTYRKLDGFDLTFLRSEDTDLCVRLALKGAHFLGISQPLVEQTLTSSSEKNIDTEYYYFRKLLIKHQEFIRKHGDLEFCLSWLKLKYSILKRDLLLSFTEALQLFLFFPCLSAQRLISALRSTKSNLMYASFYANSAQ